MARTPLAAISQDWESFAALSTSMVAASLGIVNARSFTATLARARQGKEVPIVSLMRTLELEIWLRAREQHLSSNDQSAINHIGLSHDAEASDDRSLAEVRQSLS